MATDCGGMKPIKGPSKPKKPETTKQKTKK